MRPEDNFKSGDFLIASGKSWIVHRTESAGSLATLQLFSCQEDSQGAPLQLAPGAELQIQICGPERLDDPRL